MSNKVRARIIVSGVVQGVFYRVTALKKAKAYSVVGHIKNNSNGTVEAVVEGDKNSIESFISWCQEGTDSSHVERVDIRWEDYKNEFKEFIITQY